MPAWPRWRSVENRTAGTQLRSRARRGPLFLAQCDQHDAEPHRPQAPPEQRLIALDRRVSVQLGKARQDQSADLLIDGATEPEEEVEDPHRGRDDLGWDRVLELRIGRNPGRGEEATPEHRHPQQADRQYGRAERMARGAQGRAYTTAPTSTTRLREPTIRSAT